MHADRARDKNYLMTNVIYILFISIDREDLNSSVKGGRGRSERKKVLRCDKLISMALLLFKRRVKDQGQECWVINTGEKEEGRNADEGGGTKIAFASLYILRHKYSSQNMSHFTPK